MPTWRLSLCGGRIQDKGTAKQAVRPWQLVPERLLAFRLRAGLFAGPAQGDAACLRAKERNKHASEKLNAERRAESAAQGGALPVRSTTGYELQGSVKELATPAPTSATDSFSSYASLAAFAHELVNRSFDEHVHGAVHTTVIESIRALVGDRLQLRS